MTELHEQIRARVSEALTSLQDARTEGDDHMVEVRTGELESLAHLAAEHGLHLPALAEYAADPGVEACADPAHRGRTCSGCRPSPGQVAAWRLNRAVRRSPRRDELLEPLHELAVDAGPRGDRHLGRRAGRAQPGHQRAGLRGDQPAGREVPGVEPGLEVGVEVARGHGAQVQGGAAGAAQVADVRQQRGGDRPLPGAHLGQVAEAGPGQRLSQRRHARHGHRQPLRRRATAAVQAGPTAEPGVEDLTGAGVADRPGDGRQPPGTDASPVTAATETQ